MAVQVAAHGFELTPALRDACERECKEKLFPLALHNAGAKWILSLEGNVQVAHLSWHDGSFRGDVTVKTSDMYSSIHQASKKAMEQVKKAHEKRYDQKPNKRAVGNVENGSGSGDIDDGDEE